MGLLSISFEEAGLPAVSRSWPDDPETVEEANTQPEVFAGKTVGQFADHLTGLIGELDQKPVVIGHSFGGRLTLDHRRTRPRHRIGGDRPGPLPRGPAPTGLRAAVVRPRAEQPSQPPWRPRQRTSIRGPEPGQVTRLASGVEVPCAGRRLASLAKRASSKEGWARSDEAAQEREGRLRHFLPTAADGQRVSAVGDLGGFGGSGIVLLQLIAGVSYVPPADEGPPGTVCMDCPTRAR